jgi:hypothetical protein
MGPIDFAWYEKRNLVQNGEVTTYYSGGRIDIRDDSKEGYDGWDEYSLAPMHEEDWNAFDDWLEYLETEEKVPYDELIALFEKDYGKKIRWWKDET